MVRLVHTVPLLAGVALRRLQEQGWEGADAAESASRCERNRVCMCFVYVLCVCVVYVLCVCFVYVLCGVRVVWGV
jgi:hypothetical protein